MNKNKKTYDNFVKFLNLSKRLKEAIFLKPSIQEIESNIYYLKIIKMGNVVVPFMLEDFRSGHNNLWFSALEKITGNNPIKEEHRGIIEFMIDDWLRWGEENGYIKNEK